MSCCTPNQLKGWKIFGFITASLALLTLIVVVSNPGLFESTVTVGEGEETKVVVDHLMKDVFFYTSAITTAVGSFAGAVFGTAQKCKELKKNKNKPNPRLNLGFTITFYLALAACMITAAALLFFYPNAAISSSNTMLGNLSLMLVPSILACVGMGGLLVWGMVTESGLRNQECLSKQMQGGYLNEAEEAGRYSHSMAIIDQREDEQLLTQSVDTPQRSGLTQMDNMLSNDKAESLPGQSPIGGASVPASRPQIQDLNTMAPPAMNGCISNSDMPLDESDGASRSSAASRYSESTNREQIILDGASNGDREGSNQTPEMIEADQHNSAKIPEVEAGRRRLAERLNKMLAL